MGRRDAEAVWLGVWGLWGVLGIAIASWQPGVTYIILVPTLVACVSGPTRPMPAAITAGLLHFPLLPLLYDALSAHALWLVSGLLAFTLTASWPGLRAPSKSIDETRPLP